MLHLFIERGARLPNATEQSLGSIEVCSILSETVKFKMVTVLEVFTTFTLTMRENR